jgi:hypothetical protein
LLLYFRLTLLDKAILRFVFVYTIKNISIKTKLTPLMSFIEKLRQIERVDQLIRLKGTGTPANLASRLGISENSVYNLLNILRSLGADIYYCEQRQSYCYGDYRLSLAIKPIENPDNIQAGKTFFDFFHTPQNFCGDTLHLCIM